MSFLSWSEIHGALTHMPLAFLLAVPVFEIAAAMRRNAELRIVSFWLIVAAVVMAVPSLLSGYITARTVFPDGRAPSQFQPHWMAAVLSSVLSVVLLVFRIQTRGQKMERALPVSIGFSLLIAATIGYTGYLGGKMVFGDESAAANNAELVPVVGDKGIGDKGTGDNGSQGKGSQAADPQLVATGEKLFTEYRCQACHRINGKGSATGPDLTGAGKRRPNIDWHIAHLKDPEKLVPGSSMPPFGDLSEAELKALANYIVSLK